MRDGHLSPRSLFRIFICMLAEAMPSEEPAAISMLCHNEHAFGFWAKSWAMSSLLLSARQPAIEQIHARLIEPARILRWQQCCALQCGVVDAALLSSWHSVPRHFMPLHGTQGQGSQCQSTLCRKANALRATAEAPCTCARALCAVALRTACAEAGCDVHRATVPS